MNFIQRPNKNGDKITFYYDYGRAPGQRPSTGIFIYAKPNNQIQKNHMPVQPATVYNLLFSTVWSTIQSFAADAKYLGATTGMITILHT
jgi:hypothetical protein